MISLNNVAFSVSSLVFNEQLGVNVLAPIPSLVNVYGHLVDSTGTLERNVTGNASEQERTPKYRLNCRLTDSVKEHLGFGTIIHITHKKHPDTFRWYAVTEEEQYIVHTVAQTQANGREVALMLTRKDRS